MFFYPLLTGAPRLLAWLHETALGGERLEQVRLVCTLNAVLFIHFAAYLVSVRLVVPCLPGKQHCMSETWSVAICPVACWPTNPVLFLFCSVDTRQLRTVDQYMTLYRLLYTLDTLYCCIKLYTNKFNFYWTIFPTNAIALQ